MKFYESKAHYMLYSEDSDHGIILVNIELVKSHSLLASDIRRFRFTVLFVFDHIHSTELN